MDARLSGPGLWSSCAGQDRSPARDGVVSFGAPDRQLLLRALRLLVGTPRFIVYDLPRGRAPQPRTGSPISLRASREWQRFLRQRRHYDDGELALIVALRRLAPQERRLTVDWGSKHANTLLLVEPRDPRCDLTDPTSVWRLWYDVGPSSLPTHGSTPAHLPPDDVLLSLPMMACLRRSYGLWIPFDEGEAEAVVLDLTANDSTLWAALLQCLRERFPLEAFVQALAPLRAREPELFQGHPLGRACMPFRTRLGLPVPYDPRLVLQAARLLVNRGHAWAFEQRPDGRAFCGPNRRIPEEMDDEAVARLVW